jgi:Domain of unknown function (DUF4252)
MLRILLLLTVLFSSLHVSAQRDHLFAKYRFHRGGTAIMIPGPAIRLTGLFIDGDEGGKLMRKMGSLRVLAFEERNPISKKDLAKFARKSTRKGMEELMLIRDGKDLVRIYAREKRGRLRKVVVMVSSTDEFVYISFKSRLKLDELFKILPKIIKETGMEDAVPVERI